jgi:hypothetical protein
MQELVETLSVGDRAMTVTLLTWCWAACVQLPVVKNPCSMMGQVWEDVSPNRELMKYIVNMANELHNIMMSAVVPVPPPALAPTIFDAALARLRDNTNT